MKAGVAALFVSILFPPPADAASLRVAPTSLSFVAPASVGTLTIRNDGPRAIAVQVRPFLWTQVEGRDELKTTRDVVVSPPITTLEPGVDYVVRVVRLVKRPVIGEEAYRILVDELPDPSRQTNNVKLLIRYSVPVFFKESAAIRPDVRWRLEAGKKTVDVHAVNFGVGHLRVANLKAQTRDGKGLPLRDGLVGYVLGRSSVRWSMPVRLPDIPEEEINLIGESNEGSFNGTASVGYAR
jgi:fimbrial chaperone protein